MAMCRIIEEWQNRENWKKGDEVDITDPRVLIEQGKVVLIDDNKNKIAPSGVEMKCPICIYTSEDAYIYARHILTHEHKTPSKVEISEKMEERVDAIVKDLSNKEEKPKRTPEELKAMRIENLRKAREAKKAMVV